MTHMMTESFGFSPSFIHRLNAKQRVHWSVEMLPSSSWVPLFADSHCRCRNFDFGSFNFCWLRPLPFGPCTKGGHQAASRGHPWALHDIPYIYIPTYIHIIYNIIQYFPTHRSFQIHVRLYVWNLHLWSGSFLFIDLFVFFAQSHERMDKRWMDGWAHSSECHGFFLEMYRKHPETTAKSWASSLYLLHNHEQSIELVSADCPWRRQLSFPHRYPTSYRVLWMIRYFSILLMHTIWL